jgi:membrane fusion protein (multidrug efflux system)
MKYLKWIIGTVVVVIVCIGGYFYWHHSQIYPSTDDAYVQAAVITIAPQVSGRVSMVRVYDHQHVTQGQLLVEIDPEPFRIAVETARAKLAQAQQQAQAAGAGVNAAQAALKASESEYHKALTDARRLIKLYKQRTVSKAAVDQAVAARDGARAAVAQAQANLEKAKQEQGAAGSQASLQVAQAALQQAQLELSYTRITAPADGELGEVDLRAGEVVQPGQSLFPLVKDHSYWVNANFKETDLHRIRRGQPAKISVDMLPHVTLQGTVQSISPASGAAFSLLPPENATGNWVKVSQRFPVKIALKENPQRPLRIGASAEVTVNTSGLKD